MIDDRIVLTDAAVACRAVALFGEMNRQWWASPTEAFIYNEFGDALREAMRLGVLQTDDLMTEDALVLARLDASGSPLIAAKLDAIRNFRLESTQGFAPRIVPKERWIDPLVRIDRSVKPLSTFDRSGAPESGKSTG